MLSSVTIQGTNHNTVTLGYDSSSNLALAKQIATQLNAGISAGTIVTSFDTSGPPPVLPSTISGALVQTVVPLVVLPPGYTTDLVTKPGNAFVLGSGAADQTILSDAKTSLTFVATAGSGTVAAGGGNNRLLVSDGMKFGPGPEQPPSGGGNWSLYTGNGNDLITALGSVNATIGAGGGHNTILLGGGQDMVVSTGDDSIAGGSSQATIDAAGAHSDFVQGGSSSLLFVGGSGGATIMGGTGSDTYFGSTAGPVGKQLIEGGSAGGNFLVAGDGLATLVGAGSGDQLYGFGGTGQLLIAGGGNETLSAAISNGNNKLQAGSGNDVLIGGSGSDTFVGGTGQATVTATAPNDVFSFINHQAGGTELVQGIFDPTSINIHLAGYGSDEIDQALLSQSVTGGSVTIGLTDGTKITFQDVGALTRSNFN